VRYGSATPARPPDGGATYGGSGPPPRRRPRRDAIVLAPLAWLKLQFLCHAGDTEVGGFGLSADDDPLYLDDVVTVAQAAGPAYVALDDAAVADHLDACADAGVPPARCGRVWVHTHPGESAAPSPTDERTFARAFGGCDWAVMLILARGGDAYARLAFAAGPGGAVPLGVAVDWAAWPGVTRLGRRWLGRRTAAWAAELGRNVRPLPDPVAHGGDDARPRGEWPPDAEWWDLGEHPPARPARRGGARRWSQEVIEAGAAGEGVQR